MSFHLVSFYDVEFLGGREPAQKTTASRELAKPSEDLHWRLLANRRFSRRKTPDPTRKRSELTGQRLGQTSIKWHARHNQREREEIEPQDAGPLSSNDGVFRGHRCPTAASQPEKGS
jgi:hypothetical protein